MTRMLFEPASLTFAVDGRQRTMTGVVMPWGSVGRHADGRRWRFPRGSLQFAAGGRYLSLNDEHATSVRIGRAVDVQDTDEGLMATFAVYDGPAADRAVTRATAGVQAGLSAEVEFDAADTEPDPDDPGTLIVHQAHLTAVGLVAKPAFSTARLVSVAANHQGGPVNTCGQCSADLIDGVTHECAPASAPAASAPAASAVFSAAQMDQLRSMLGAGNGQIQPRPVVDPIAGRVPAAPARVVEPLPYRFSYRPGAEFGSRYTFAADADHDFSRDIFAIINSNGSDNAAVNRVNALISAAFDTDRADLPGLSPNVNRPDLWMPQLDYPTPLWDLLGSGTTDERPFDVPKFSSSSGLVNAATEGTEPAVGSFVTAMQTITPTQVWGKLELTRQAARRASTPQLSGILWDQMMREYFEDREASIATFLNTLTAATDISLPGVDASPDNTERLANCAALEAALASLQFDRGGNQITAFAVHRALWTLLVATTDTSGRPLYPQISPMNANGTVGARYRSMNIGGVTAVPAYGLDPSAGANASVNSWLFDPSRTRAWASAPERLDWNFGATVQTANIPQLSHVTIGIYGNIAVANMDIGSVRQVIFDKNTAA
jgi:hypothetical protein